MFDIVIIKKDGLPTYHFAHIVDDYLMFYTVNEDAKNVTIMRVLYARRNISEQIKQ